jgi:uncharacterized protein (DUF1499 family)
MGMKTLTRALLGLSGLCLLIELISGPGTRFGLFGYRTGLKLFFMAGQAGLIVGIAALFVLIFAVYKRAPKKLLGLIAFAVLLSVAAGLPGRVFKAKAGEVPRIHDITTDPDDPPKFVDIVRPPGTNSLEYAGERIKEQQLAAYPDIKPATMAFDANAAFERALSVARSMGWRIVADKREEGRLEATATTAFFGFKDDIVIRIRKVSDSTSTVDIRSSSRVGLSDVGANAARIRAFLKQLASPSVRSI